MHDVEHDPLEALGLSGPHDNVKPLVAAVVELGAEGSVGFDTDDHLVGGIFQLHVVGLLFILLKPGRNLVHLVRKGLRVLILALQLSVILAVHTANFLLCY